MNKTEKAHKYNVGDTFTVKIAETFKVNGKSMYRIEGMGIPVSEKVLEKMRQDRIMPGDTVHVVIVEHEERTIAFECYKVQDISTKEIKIRNDWMPFNYNEIFRDEKLAEKYAEAQAMEYGYVIRKGSLFRQEAVNADGN